MDGVTSTVRLAEIGQVLPKMASDIIRDVLEQGLAYLQEDLTRSPSNTRQPFDTGLMRQLTADFGIRVVNQYKGELTSPVDYTEPQEYGFYNVWAKRWLAGRFFMHDAEIFMQSIADQVTAEYLERL